MTPDTEQHIFDCWNVVKDIDTVFEYIMNSEKVDDDKVANMLLGMRDLYELKFGKLMDDYEKTIEIHYQQVSNLKDTINSTHGVLGVKDGAQDINTTRFTSS